MGNYGEGFGIDQLLLAKHNWFATPIFGIFLLELGSIHVSKFKVLDLEKILF